MHDTARRTSLDALRGLAVVLMVEQHLGVWLWRGPARGETVTDYPLLLAFNALGGGAAPLFILLAGVGSALMAAARTNPDRTMIVRGLLVMALGYGLSLATPSWFTWRSWFVLHLMGLGMVLAPALRRLGIPALLAVAGVIFVLTPFVQTWLATPLHLENPRMAGWSGTPGRSDVLPGGHLRLALAEGQFPVLPWLGVFVLGIVAGRLSLDRPGQVGRLAAAVGLPGLLTSAIGLGFPVDSEVLARAFRVTVPFFPASPAEVCVLAGLALAAVRVALALETRRWLGPHHPLVVLGRTSLTLLIVHVILFREATRPVGLWQASSPAFALAVIVGFLAVAAVVARAWGRIGWIGGAEWLLRRAAP